MINHTLFFNNKRFQLSIEYRRYVQIIQSIPQEIGIKLAKNEIYIVQSKVSLNVFQDFLKFWQNSQEPSISYDNLFEYYILSQEFGIMNDYILEKFNENDIRLANLKYCTNGNQESTLCDKSNQEKYIATNLDLFLEKYGDHISKIPINSLVNIFFHKDRVLNDQQKAFDFINKLISNSSASNSNYSILLSSLDSIKLNQESVIDSISKEDEHFGFHPKISPLFFSSFNMNKDEKDYQLLLNKIIAELYENGSSDIIKLIITDECYDVNSKIILEKGTNEITALYYAIENEDIETASIILQRPSLDINIKSCIEGDEITPLHHSIEKENSKILALILSNPELDINLKSHIKSNEITPLHHAIEKENSEVLMLVLSQSKLDVNASSIIKEERNSNEEYHLFSNEEEDEESIEIQFNKKVEITPLYLAIKNNNKGIASLLLSRPELDVNIKMNKVETTSIESLNLSSAAIKYACSLMESAESIINSKDECKKALEVTIKKEETALFLAIKNNFYYIMPFLFSRKNIDVYAKSSISFKIRSKIKHEKILEGDGKIEKTALDLSIQNSEFDVVKLLFARHDLDINSKSLKEANITCSLFAFAIYESIIKSKIMASFLGIEKFAFKQAIELKFKIENPAFYLAVLNKNVEIIKLFLSRPNLDVNVKAVIEIPKCTCILLASEELIREKAPKLIDSMEKLIREKNEEEIIKATKEHREIILIFFF